MKLKNGLFFLLFVFCGNSFAETTVQTLCFSNPKNSRTTLTLRQYLDVELNKEVAAFAKYGTSKQMIPLVYVDNGISDDSLDYQLDWLEVFEEKLTGTYQLLKPKGATIYGAYVKYKNFKTGKETIFSPSGKSDDECLATLK